MREGSFRFAATLAGAFAVAACVVAWVYDLPIRDPDGTIGPYYVLLPLIVAAAIAADVLPRALWRARRAPLSLRRRLVDVVHERWPLPQLKFTLVGLAAWYLSYAAFRNLKSAVPFVNLHLWDRTLDAIDHAIFLGHDPAVLLHHLFGESWAAQLFSSVYVVWIGLVPFSLAVALVWTRNHRVGAWYVTAIAADWMLGAATYFLVPSLGPVYSDPERFASLPRTWNSSIVEQLMDDRHAVLVNPYTTHALQTIAAFASLHVAVMATAITVAETARLPRIVRVSLWVFSALTVLATLYLGWHFFVDVVAGAALGYAGAMIGAWGTGIQLRLKRMPIDALQQRA